MIDRMFEQVYSSYDKPTGKVGLMIFEKIKTEGLADLSYMIGDGMEAVVIDPRRDCQVYIDIASAHGMRIRRVFGTHRNEDFVVGSLDLAGKTGAKIYHGSKLDYSYGESVVEGDTFQVGRCGNHSGNSGPYL